MREGKKNNHRHPCRSLCRKALSGDAGDQTSCEKWENELLALGVVGEYLDFAVVNIVG